MKSSSGRYAEYFTYPTFKEADNGGNTRHDKKKKRNYEEAIVHGCRAMDATVEEKRKNHWIIEQLKLEPFSLLAYDHNNNVIEYNAFAHHDNNKAISGKTMSIIGNVALNNDILTSLAAKLSSDISRTNSKVVSAIQERSSEYQ